MHRHSWRRHRDDCQLGRASYLPSKRRILLAATSWPFWTCSLLGDNTQSHPQPCWSHCFVIRTWDTNRKTKRKKATNIHERKAAEEELGKVFNFRLFFVTRSVELQMSQQRKKWKYEPEKRSEEALRWRELLLSLSDQLHSLLLVISHCSAGEFDDFSECPPRKSHFWKINKLLLVVVALYGSAKPYKIQLRAKQFLLGRKYFLTKCRTSVEAPTNCINFW